MSSLYDNMTSQDVVELSKVGVPLTHEMEAILLRDPHSKFYKEHFTHVLNEVIAEINLETLSYEFTQHKEAIDAYEEQCFLEEQRARAAEEDKQADSDAQTASTQEIRQYQLTPTTMTLPMIQEFKVLTAEYDATQETLLLIDTQQDSLRKQWREAQTQEANQLVQTFDHAPVLLPNGKPLAANLTLRLPANSPEAKDLAERLAAAPMLPDLINQSDNTRLRGVFNSQVAFRQQQLQATHPALAQDRDTLEMESRNQAVKDLKLDVRQLQNRFLLSVSAIYNFLKNQGGNTVGNLVEQYNAALGIRVDKESHHKQFGIYKIIENTIAPLLTPKLQMGKRRHVELDTLDPNELHQLAMKGDMQAQRLKQQQLARLSSMRAMIASLRLMADSDPAYGFLHDVCNRLISQPNAVMTPFLMQPVPKGYLVK